jgi:hypothetical protein
VNNLHPIPIANIWCLDFNNKTKENDFGLRIGWWSFPRFQFPTYQAEKEYQQKRAYQRKRKQRMLFAF